MTKEEIIQNFKIEQTDLFNFYKGLSHEELLNQIILEVTDLQAMEERVSFFMSECTCNMSKTNYTIDSLKTLVEERKQRDHDESIQDFCEELLSLEDKGEICKTIQETFNEKVKR